MPFDTQAVVNSAWGEPLAYVRGGTGTTHLVTGTRHLKGTEEGRTSFGVYLIQKELVTLASDALPFDPRPRDTVAPAGKYPRTVTSVGGSPWLKFWTLESQYPSLVDDLDAVATVSRPAPTPTADGMRTPNLGAVYSNVAVRLQPDTRTREWDTAGKVTTRAKFVCVFGAAVVLNAGDVVQVAGVKYEVAEQGEMESLGLLTFAAVERIS
jgi:hypothetical protein